MSSNEIFPHQRIKELIDNDHVIICDTNIYLGLYRSSPDYAAFALSCLQSVKEYVVLPHTVCVEFFRHHKELFDKWKSSIETAGDAAIKLLRKQKKSLKNTWGVLVSLHFPDADTNLDVIEKKFSEIEAHMQEYFENHSFLDTLKDGWDTDKVASFVQDCIESGQQMEPFSQYELYGICSEGEKRYKDSIPPGFKDTKGKDGIRKYSDLIIWKEILRYAASQRKNIIFVTDDAKADWWTINGERKEFLPQLLQEFDKKTRTRSKDGSSLPAMKIVPLISNDFFNAVSADYQIEKTDAVEQALRITLSSYINFIAEDVFTDIQDKLAYSEMEYIDESSLTEYGGERMDEWEIEEYALDSYSLEDRDGEQAVYRLVYLVTMSSNSYEYWGRDDETKEVIESPPYGHTVQGKVEVQVVRTVEIPDFPEFSNYDEVEIIFAEFKESAFKSPWGEEDEDEYCPEAYTTCPSCGRKINWENDGGNGFCIHCTSDL